MILSCDFQKGYVHYLYEEIEKKIKLKDYIFQKLHCFQAHKLERKLTLCY